MNAAAFNVESNSDVDSDLLIVGRMSHLAGICWLHASGVIVLMANNINLYLLLSAC